LLFDEFKPSILFDTATVFLGILLEGGEQIKEKSFFGGGWVGL